MAMCRIRSSCYPQFVRRTQYILPIFLAVLLNGCKHAPAILQPQPSTDQKEMADAQMELAQVPLPVKSRYLTVHSLSEWENPYLTVQAEIITLHVLMPDDNPSPLGQGGMLRPIGARRQELTLRLGDLPQALTAIPVEAWPYGRVITVEEQHGADSSAEPAVRRNVEATLKMLNDLGLVADEWTEQQ
jgi:hypothetical protein